MIQSYRDVCPSFVADELLRLSRLDRDWVEWVPLDGQSYSARSRHPTWLREVVTSGQDWFSMHSTSLWMLDGPKIFRPTARQCEAMEQIEVNLALGDYAQPYPALLVELPDDGRYAPFENVLCHRSEKMLVCVLKSEGWKNDITTTIAIDGRDIEVSLNSYDEDCVEHSVVANKVLRVAINSCLALVNYGNRKELLFKKQGESDRRLAQEKGERGEKARERLKLAIRLVSFAQDVHLHETESRDRVQSEGGDAGSGGQVCGQPIWHICRVQGVRNRLGRLLFLLDCGRLNTLSCES